MAERQHWIKRVVTVLPRIVMRSAGLYSMYYLRRYGYLRSMHWYRSFDTEKVIGPGSEPLPWITYPCIHFLEQRLTKHMSVFEFGSGGSTLWWAARVGHVVTVEHNRDWYDALIERLPGNVTPRFVPHDNNDGSYCRAATIDDRRYEIVMIDARDRINCARHSVGALTPDGVIVWDNTDRAQYSEGFLFLQRLGFRQLEFRGMGPRCVEGWTSSVFYRSHNCLGL